MGGRQRLVPWASLASCGGAGRAWEGVEQAGPGGVGRHGGRSAVGRQTAGDEADLVQFDRFFDFQGRPQVAVVDGIEGSAVYADHERSWGERP